MAMKYTELQSEADQLKARCEVADGLNVQLAQQLEAMVQIRFVMCSMLICDFIRTSGHSASDGT